MTEDTHVELYDKIDKLRSRHKAVILVHNYQLAEVQDIGDYVGDSLDLSRKAASIAAEVIVFCGVHFMAETAVILSPDKTVLLPALEAGCPLANMATAEQLRRMKAEHPEAVVVSYVNSSAEIKAESDICCTSSNAVKVVEQIEGDREIIFLPDQNLGDYVQSVTGRRMILWPGFCPTHVRILPEHITRKKMQFPDASVIVHPECSREVVRMADEVLSTGGMCRYAREADAPTIIVGTELGMIHRLEKENPEKHFVPATEQAVCPNMKMIRLDQVLWALEELKHQIQVPEPVRSRAETAVQRMIAVG